MEPIINLDCSDQILGRLSSYISKQLLSGKKIKVFNIENVIITGDRTVILKKYKHRLSLGTLRKGPFYGRTVRDIFLKLLEECYLIKKKR